MKKIQFQIKMSDDETAERTAYFLPDEICGFRFVVVRDDSPGLYGISTLPWSVSQYDTGLKAGVSCKTRAEAVETFLAKWKKLVDNIGLEKMKKNMSDIVSENLAINT